ncbi:MAG: hypothetical protein AB1896_22325, partial [Thermodesulfobacteriota bacterium]
VTRERRRWRLAWNNMSEGDYATLAAFFDANQGGSFNWVHPVTGTGYLCRFAGDALRGDAEKPGRRKVEIEIEEV